MTAALAIDGLDHGYPERRLFTGLALELGAGERLSIQGPSGCGKTTLLRLIAGLEAPQSGTIELCGRPASRAGKVLLPPWRRGVQMVFQDLGLWPTRSVRANVRDACRAAGVADPDGRTDAVLQRLGLVGLAARKPSTLSGGEARRLAFARALALEPELLLLDEPFASLDAENRSAGFALLEEVLAATAAAVILVTHDPEEAARLGGRDLRLQEGKLA